MEENLKNLQENINLSESEVDDLLEDTSINLPNFSEEDDINSLNEQTIEDSSKVNNEIDDIGSTEVAIQEINSNPMTDDNTTADTPISSDVPQSMEAFDTPPELELPSLDDDSPALDISMDSPSDTTTDAMPMTDDNTTADTSISSDAPQSMEAFDTPPELELPSLDDYSPAIDSSMDAPSDATETMSMTDDNITADTSISSDAPQSMEAFDTPPELELPSLDDDSPAIDASMDSSMDASSDATETMPMTDDNTTADTPISSDAPQSMEAFDTPPELELPSLDDYNPAIDSSMDSSMDASIDAPSDATETMSMTDDNTTADTPISSDAPQSMEAFDTPPELELPSLDDYNPAIDASMDSSIDAPSDATTDAMPMTDDNTTADTPISSDTPQSMEAFDTPPELELPSLDDYNPAIDASMDSSMDASIDAPSDATETMSMTDDNTTADTPISSDAPQSMEAFDTPPELELPSLDDDSPAIDSSMDAPSDATVTNAEDSKMTEDISSQERSAVIENNLPQSHSKDANAIEENINYPLETFPLNQKELTLLVQQIDSILGFLPKYKIQEFAHSEYYDKYIYLINKLKALKEE